MLKNSWYRYLQRSSPTQLDAPRNQQLQLFFPLARHHVVVAVSAQTLGARRCGLVPVLPRSLLHNMPMPHRLTRCHFRSRQYSPVIFDRRRRRIAPRFGVNTSSSSHAVSCHHVAILAPCTDLLGLQPGSVWRCGRHIRRRLRHAGEAWPRGFGSLQLPTSFAQGMSGGMYGGGYSGMGTGMYEQPLARALSPHCAALGTAAATAAEHSATGGACKHRRILNAIESQL